MTLFKGKYRIESIRLRKYDYSSAGSYFVTMCTRGRVNYFGEVVDGKIELSRMGHIASEEWQKTPLMRPNVTLDQWVVMPNHFHGIVTIGESRVETHSSASQRSGNQFGPQSKNLASIIRGFKAACTNRIHSEGYLEFQWQARFYEHVIRDGDDLDRIREYILDNPAEWNADEDYPRNVRVDPLHRGVRDWSPLD